jgi:hypothetical protein
MSEEIHTALREAFQARKPGKDYSIDNVKDNI